VSFDLETAFENRFFHHFLPKHYFSNVDIDIKKWSYARVLFAQDARDQ